MSSPSGIQKKKFCRPAALFNMQLELGASFRRTRRMMSEGPLVSGGPSFMDGNLSIVISNS